MARKGNDFDFVSKTATEEDAKKFGLRDLLSFHYFNPNGVVKKFEEEYSFLLHEVVIPGAVPTGWLLAYNADTYIDSLIRQHRSKAFPKRFQVLATISLIEESRQKLINKINEAFPEND